jgi:hypothetical protein
MVTWGSSFFWDTINLVIKSRWWFESEKASSSGCSSFHIGKSQLSDPCTGNLAPVMSCKSGRAASFDAAWQIPEIPNVAMTMGNPRFPNAVL